MFFTFYVPSSLYMLLSVPHKLLDKEKKQEDKIILTEDEKTRKEWVY